jgi:predicted RND superfamily exporter protein
LHRRSLSDEQVNYRMEHNTGSDRKLELLARYFIRHRRVGVVLQLVIAALCIWALFTLKLRDDPNAWPPRNDPFVQLNEQIMGAFGGGNSVSIEVLATSGSIFNKSHLNTIKDITDDLHLVPGVIPYAVRSLSSLSSESYAFLNKGRPDETMSVTPIMPDAPQSEEDAARIKAAVKANPMLDGVLASKDGKAALILADFRTEVPAHALVQVTTTDPVDIYHAVNRILSKHQTPGLILRAAGTPIIVGWVNSTGLRYIFGAFAFFVLIIGVVLWYGFRTYSAVVLPLRVSFLGVLMGFGLYRVFFGPTIYSASALLAPFIIVAAGACHSVQFLTRFFYEEYPRLKNTDDAIVSTFVSRLRPMLVSLLCDVVPFLVMAAIPFDNVRMLGIVTSLGLLSLTVDEFLLMIPALSYVTLAELDQVGGRVHKDSSGQERLDHSLASMVRGILNAPRVGIAVVLACVALTAASLVLDMRAPIGQDNTYAIHNYLTRSWNRSSIFQMERGIVERFGGVYPMTVLVSAKPGAGKVLETPAVLKAVDELAGFLRKQPGIGNVADVAYPVKLSNSFMHGDEQQFFKIPDTPGELGLEVLDIADHAPGAYLWLFTNDLTQTVVISYSAGTDPILVKRLIRATQQKASELFQGLPVTVGVAGGSVGIAQAFNDNIGYWLLVGALLGFIGTALLAMPFIGSVRLSLILTVPLIMGTVISLAVMYLLGIELNSNAIAALAIASGVGIDSEVYLLFRVREEYAKLGDFRESLVQGYVKIRRALVVSNGALILGCWALTPVPLYIGYVGFGMGMVLFWCFLMSAVLSPLLWSWFGEEVVTGGVRKKSIERSDAMIESEYKNKRAEGTRS